MMSPLETDKSSNLRFLFAAYTAKACELAPTWNDQGEVERKAEANEISERAQQEEFAIGMEENENDEYGFACLESLVSTIKM